MNLVFQYTAMIPSSIFRLLVIFLLGNTLLMGQTKPSQPLPLTAKEVKALGYGNMSFRQKKTDVWQLANGITVYSSRPYGGHVCGFAGPTPVFIAVNAKGKITGIVPAPNGETENYFSYLHEDKFFNSWNGMTLKEAAQYEPDAISGATYSSEAVKETVKVTASRLINKK